MTYTVAVCTVKTPDEGERNCPKHVEFYSKNKFEKFVHLIGFIIRIYHDARSPGCQRKGSEVVAGMLLKSLLFSCVTPRYPLNSYRIFSPFESECLPFVAA